MLQMIVRTLFCVVLVVQLSAGLAAAPAIGVATASGSIRLDDARVSGNGTLFEGTTVVTGAASSRLQLDDGVRMELASSSRGTVYRDRMVLERGAGQLDSARDFRIEALGLAIVSDEPESSARVVLGEDLVQVASLRGSFRVTNGEGVVLAALPAGRALAFQVANSGASAPSVMAGCLTKSGGTYLLRDDTTGVTVELRGKDFDREVGNEVAITGVIVQSAKAADGASQVFQVSDLERVSNRCSSGAPGAAAPGQSVGMSRAKKSIIAGVIVAAAGTGAALGLTRGSDDPPTISR